MISLKEMAGYLLGAILFVALLPAIMWLASGMPCWTCPPLWRIALSALLCLCGLALSIWTIVYMKRRGKGNPMDAFDHEIGPRTQHLMTDGPYRINRNPMLTGTFIYLIGWIILLWTWQALLVWVVFVAIMLVQVLSEEKRLRRDFGEEYRAYCRRTDRFLPLLFLLVSMAAVSCGSSSPQVGTVVRDTVCDVPCCVYLPNGYARADSHYPVLYLHHGMWGNENDWTEQGRLLPIMDSLLRLGEVKEWVIVMPDNCPHRETYEQERDNAMSGEWEKRFPDFMAEVESRYPVSNRPAERAIAGLSMGGFHSMHVSHHLHGQFAYVGLFSPAIRPTQQSDVYAPWETEVRLQMASTLTYWIGIGREDFLYDNVTEYRRWLEANHLEYTYYESAGGHTWDNWQDYIVRFLKTISR